MLKPKLKIGIDCLAVDVSYRGGINSFLFGLLDGFAKLNPQNISFIIFCDKRSSHLFHKYADSFKIVIINKYNKRLRKIFLVLPFIIGSPFIWCLLNNLYAKIIGVKKIFEEECDILYTATTNLNFYNLDIPTIVSMHDIQQYHYPENFTFKELIYRKLLFTNSAKFSSFFQASSNFIKEDIKKIFLNIKNEQIKVIPEGVDVEKFSKQRDIVLIKKFDLPSKYIFLPAQLWNHKNHITVLKAILLLKEKKIEIPIVFTGAKYGATHKIFQFIKKQNMQNVIYLGLVESEELISIYQNAFLTLSPAIYESSSLTILESAASGTPILASKTSPNVEMSCEIEIDLFETMNYTELANKISIIWEKKNVEINRVISINKKNIDKFSWENIAKKYINLFIDIHDGQSLQ